MLYYITYIICKGGAIVQTDGIIRIIIGDQICRLLLGRTPLVSKGKIESHPPSYRTIIVLSKHYYVDNVCRNSLISAHVLKRFDSELCSKSIQFKTRLANLMLWSNCLGVERNDVFLFPRFISSNKTSCKIKDCKLQYMYYTFSVMTT